MKKRKEIFSFGLYKEGLRRIKLPGIIFFVILALEALIVPIGSAIDTYSYVKDISAIVPDSVSALEVHPLMVISIFIIAPVFTYTLFSFLNKRRASDHYHALPHTRLSLFLSTVAALVTWTVGLIVSTGLISVLGHMMFPRLYTVLFSTYVSAAVGCIVASLLVSSVMIIAISITGMVLNNIVLSGIILFLPRMVISLISEAVIRQVPIIPRGYLSILMSSKINILTGWMEDIFYYSGYSAYDTGLTGVHSQIYTGVLAVLYLAVACVLFIRRKSESAERSAPSPFMQAVYRIIVAMVVCVPVCFLLFVEEIKDSSELFTVFVLYLFATVVYFAYEIITTRKLKNLLKAIPGLGIVAILNVAIILVMNGFCSAEMGFAPDAEDIEYVSIVSPYTSNIKNHYLSYSDYINAIGSEKEIKITDENSLRIVSESLAENIEKIEDESYRNSYLRYDSIKKQKYEKQTVFISSKDGKKYRNLYMPVEDYNALTAAYEGSEDYKKLWKIIPKAVPGGVMLLCSGNGTVLPDRDGERLLDILRGEMESSDTDRLISFFNGAHGSYIQYSPTTHILIETDHEGSPVSVEIPLSPDYLPKTFQAYLDLIGDFRLSTNSELKKCLSSESDSYSTIQSGGRLFEYSEKKGAYEISSLIWSDDKRDEVLKLISSFIRDKKPAVGESFLMFNVTMLENITDKYDNENIKQDYDSIETVAIPLSCDECDILRKYLLEIRYDDEGAYVYDPHESAEPVTDQSTSTK